MSATPNSISTHIAAGLSAVVAAIAALHPGFTLSGTVTQEIVTVGTVGAILLEGQHGVLKAKALQYAHEADLFFRKLGVTPSELATGAKVVEAKLKPADQQLVDDIMSGAKTVLEDPTQPSTTIVVKPAPGPAPIEGATLPQT